MEPPLDRIVICGVAVVRMAASPSQRIVLTKLEILEGPVADPDIVFPSVKASRAFDRGLIGDMP